MALFGKKRGYDRRRVLEEAERARARNKRRQAIALYRWILAVEPNNAELHAKLAPLLAETGQSFDAWRSYRVTATAALREARDDKALAIYREAAERLPRELQAWQGLAQLLAKQGNTSEAVAVLLKGSQNFRRSSLRPEAIHLLRRARCIDAWHFDAVFELSRHLARAGQREEARMLLDGLAERSSGEPLRRVRGAQFRLDRSLAAAWRWLRAALRPEEAPAPRERAAGVVALRSRARH
ncbi:MAG: tetratricopeptide repeat protein [Myxococcales bacterium]|nr:tetratricopeptide repeat protein [Myxococcales bacterium]MDH5567134.1 tetratricopeptide repeat protein [Myxococcales bacterium]